MLVVLDVLEVLSVDLESFENVKIVPNRACFLSFK